MAALSAVTSEISFPPAISSGPTAAAARATFAMVCWVDSGRLAKAVASSVTFSATFCTVGASASPKEIAAASTALERLRKLPPMPDSMVSAMACVAPWESVTACDSSS